MSNVTSTFRSYTDHDREHVIALNDIARVPGLNPESWEQWYADLYDVPGVYLSPGGVFLIGEVAMNAREKIMTSMGGLKPHSMDVAEIKRIRVHPDFAGQGLARRMVDELIEEAREHHFQMVIAHTTDEQHQMKYLFASDGFDETHRSEAGGTTMVHFSRTL